MEVELNQMNYTKVANLKLRKRQEVIKNPNCISNKEGFEDNLKISIDAYRCSCSSKDRIICESCAKICHAGHKITKQGSEKNFVCDCAANGHSVVVAQNRVKLDKNLRTEESINKSKCNMNKLFGQMKPEHYFSEVGTNNILCFYCIKNCSEKKIDEDFEMIPSSQFPKNPPKCACQNVNDHGTRLKNLKCFINLLRQEEMIEDYINLQKLFNNFIISNPTYKNYYKAIIDTTNDIAEKIKNNNYFSLQDQSLPSMYISCLDLFVNFGKLIKKNYYLIDINNHLGYSISIDYLMLLFNTIEVKYDFLIYPKIRVLYLFRKFYMLPKINSLGTNIIGWDYNTNPIHRIIFLKPIEELFEKIGISERNFIGLLDKIYVSINSYFDIVDELEYISFIREYLKIVRIMINYRYKDDDLQISLLDKISKIYQLLGQSKLDSKMIARDIEKILYLLILKQNDGILYSILILGEKSTSLKFSFENTDLNVFILKTLFVNDIDIGVIKVNVNKSEIYDLYINKNDLYSQSLKNLIHTKYKILNENINIFTENSNKTRLLEIFTPKIQEMIRDQINILDTLRQNYYSNNCDDEEFFNKTIYTIEKSYKLIENIFININRDKEVLFYQQSFLFVKGFIESLFRVWNIYSKNNYNLKKFSIKKLESIAFEMMRILKLILYNNPFLISIFFNPPLVNMFFYKEKDKPRKPVFLCYYEFYLNILKVLKNYNYKLDYTYFIDQLLNVETIDEDWDSKIKFSNCILKIFSNILPTSLENSSSTINDRIEQVLTKIITSKPFCDALDHLFDFYSDRLKKPLYLLKIESILKPNTIDITLREDFVDLLVTIKTSYKCFGLLNTPNFIRLSKYAKFEKFSYLLRNTKFDVKIRKIIVQSFLKYQFINNYTIFSNMTPEQFDKLSYISTAENRIIFSEENNYTLLLENMEKYPFILDSFSDTFKRSLKFYISYFQEVIIIPTLNATFQIIYFSKTINSKLKYYIYQIIYLFFEVYKMFLENLIKFNFASKINFLLLSSYFFDLRIDHLEEDFLEIIRQLDSEIKTMNTNNFKLDLKSIIEIYTHFNQKFIYFKIILKEKILKEEDLPQFYLSLNEILKDYKRKKKDFFSSNNVMYLVFNEEEFEKTQKIKKNILLNLFYRLSLLKDQYSNESGENNQCFSDMIYFESIVNLFLTDPNIWQNALTEMADFTYKLITNIFLQLSILIQSVFIDFNRLEDSNSKTNKAYNFVLILLEFLRLLTENHHKIYQTFLINSNINKESNLEFSSFLFKIQYFMLNHIEYTKSKTDFVKNYKPKNYEYFDRLSVKVSDLLIELFQGTFHFNFDTICQNKDFLIYYDKHYKLMDSLESEQEYLCLISQFMRIIIVMLEEYSNSQENKLNLIKKFNPTKLLTIIFFTFKKLYQKYVKDVLDSNAHEQLTEVFILNDEISSDPLFNLCTSIFIFFKMGENTSQGKKIVRTMDFWEKISESHPKNLKEKDLQSFLIRRDSYIFLHKIIKCIDLNNKISDEISDKQLIQFKIFFKDKKKLFKKIKMNASIQDIKLQKTVFLVSSISLLIIEHDLNYFLLEAPIEKLNEKMAYFIKSVDSFIDTALMRKFLFEKKSKFLNLMFKLNYHYVDLISLFMGVCTNIIMLSSAHYTKLDENSDLVIQEPLEIYAIYLSIVHFMFNFFFSFNWLVFGLIKLNKFVHNRPDITKYQKFRDNVSLLVNPEIFPLLWMLMFNIMGSISNFYNSLYSLQLFPIFFLIPTMKIVITAIKVRYQKFISTTILIFIFILIYASISFMYIRKDFYVADINENICDSLLKCFFSIFNYGIRGGLGLLPQKSWEDTDYLFQFAFVWIFYFLMILILINIVNGIIVDTFQDLREQQNERDNVSLNYCYICSLNRTKFDMRGLDFNNHIIKEHSILDYLYYIIKIKDGDPQDFNSLDLQILNAINDLRIDFFPIKTASSIKQADEQNQGK